MALTNAERQARHRANRSPMTYGQAVRWLVLNDDCSWVYDGPQSITAGFIADCFGKSSADVRTELQRQLAEAEWQLEP